MPYVPVRTFGRFPTFGADDTLDDSGSGSGVADDSGSSFWSDVGSGLVDVAKGVAGAIPKNTVVGKAIAGDYTGAAKGAVALVKGTSTPPAKSKPVAKGGVFGVGGAVDKSTMPLLMVAGLLGLWLVVRKKGRR